MAAVKDNIANNQTNTKVGQLETQQKLLYPHPNPHQQEEGWLQAENIQREKKLNVSNTFRVGNIKTYLTSGAP